MEVHRLPHSISENHHRATLENSSHVVRRPLCSKAPPLVSLEKVHSLVLFERVATHDGDEAAPGAAGGVEHVLGGVVLHHAEHHWPLHFFSTSNGLRWVSSPTFHPRLSWFFLTRFK